MDPKKALSERRRMIGERLAEARKNAKMTQSGAAEALTKRGYKSKDGGPLESSRIGNYEQGTRLPDPVLVEHLCDIYGAFASWVYGFKEAPQSHDEFALTLKYRHTDDRGKKAVQGVADAQPAYVTPDGKKEKSG